MYDNLADLSKNPNEYQWAGYMCGGYMCGGAAKYWLANDNMPTCEYMFGGAAKYWLANDNMPT